MRVVGLTGGIGGGKTTVAKCFRARGVPVYNADQRARSLMNKSKALKARIIDLLGPQAYRDGRLNADWVADRVFHDPVLLDGLNAIEHPAVAKDFCCWLAGQRGEFVVKEAAVLFEAGADAQCDAIITVLAPADLRIRRVQKRDGLSVEAIRARMDKQWPDREKAVLSDYVIWNDKGRSDLEKSVWEVYEKLKRRLNDA